MNLKIFGVALLIAVSAIMIYYFGCSQVEKNKKPESVKKPELKTEADRIIAIDTVFKYKLNRVVHYTKLPVEGRKTLRVLDSLYGSEGKKLILTLNRLDSRNLRKNDTLVIPDTIANLMSFSPFPFLIEELKSIPKILFVSRKVQAFAAYKNGVLIKWGPTSTGRKVKQTPAGFFSLTWKKKETISTIDEEWILPFYFNFINFEGVAFHQYMMPGYPASHGCVRLLKEDAEWIFSWGEQWILTKNGLHRRAYGTPVIVFGDYEYGKPRPWRRLTNEKTLEIQISENEIKEVLKNYLPDILKRSTDRDSVVQVVKFEKMKRDSILAARNDSIKTAKK